MRRRFIATLVAGLGLGLVIAPVTAGPAQAAPGQAIFTVAAPTTVYQNQDAKFTVDFPTGTYDGVVYGNYPYLAIKKSTDGTNFTQHAAGVKSSSAGVLAMTYNVGTANSWIQVCNDLTKPNGQAGKLFNDGKTEICTTAVAFKPLVAPAAGITLAVASNAKGATATFTGAAAKSGQSASLQVLPIVTKMTNEVTTASWKTIATATQNSSGVATFSVSNPYEVKHQYRAVTGTSPQHVSNVVSDIEAPVGAKTTGVAQAYFNSNEQASVNTRTQYFEGRFSLVQAGSSAKYATCNTPMVKKGATVTGGQRAAMKGRGNYSWSFSKKSFTLKLDDKLDLCGLGASKKYALVANHYDKSLMRNTVADHLGNKLLGNLAWTPDSRPVDFWINGAYQGSYILIERMDADPATPRLPYEPADDNRLIAAKDTPGFLLEWDFRKGADKNVTVGSRGYVGIKDPENDYDADGSNNGTGITSAQVSYIDDYLDKCDAKLFGSGFASTREGEGWRSCIDAASAVDYYIGMELMKPVDGNMWASVYMWKPANGKLQFGPLWDFDLGAGSANRAGNAVSPTGWYLRDPLSISAKQSTKTWFNRLNEDSGFRAAVRARYRDLYDNKGLKNSVLSFVDGEKGRVSSSAAENFRKWSVTEKLSTVQVVKGSWSAEVSYLRGWLDTRMTWMRANI